MTATADAVGGAPVWDECPDNVSNVFEAGNRAAADAALAQAPRVIKRRYVITRVHAQYMEARGALGVYDRGEDRYTLYADVQYPHRVRNALASNIFKVPEHQIRVIAGDVGGGFGTKGWQYPEHRLVLWAARKLGRPVKWRCERREAIPADEHARDNVTDAELALDADGKFLGLRVRTLANVGAYVSSDRNLLATFSNVVTLVGVYEFPAAHVEVTSVLTNTNSTAPYRGAGRPEATYVIERLIDDAARELGLDPIELRRKNLIPASAMPYKNPLGVTYDSGDFPKNMEDALKLADVAGFAAPARGVVAPREAARHRDREPDRAGGRAAARVRGDPLRPERDGHRLHGQQEPGAGTRDDVQADPARAARHRPARGAVHRRRHRPRGLRHGNDGLALHRDRRHRALDGRRQGDRQGPEDRRAASRGGRRRTSCSPTAASPWPAPTARSRSRRSRARRSSPASCRRGSSPASTRRERSCRSRTRGPTAVTSARSRSIRRRARSPWPATSSSTTSGTVINPVTLKGQIHGGIAQGVGQALMEQVVYDRHSGQLLTASFMEYAMPRADTFCDMAITSNPVPTKLNPLGAKGAGEAGTVGALPAVINAVVDALAPLGVRDFDMPATSDRVWEVLHAASGRR